MTTLLPRHYSMLIHTSYIILHNFGWYSWMNERYTLYDSSWISSEKSFKITFKIRPMFEFARANPDFLKGGFYSGIATSA